MDDEDYEFDEDLTGGDAGDDTDDENECSGREEGFLKGYKESDDIDKTVDFEDDAV